jgi:hypothetical protein
MNKTVDYRNDVKLTGRKIRVLRCVTGYGPDEQAPVGELYRPEKSVDYNIWFEITDVSPDCRYFTRDNIGDKILLPAMAVGKTHKLTNVDIVVKESLFDDNTRVIAGKKRRIGRSYPLFVVED